HAGTTTPDPGHPFRPRRHVGGTGVRTFRGGRRAGHGAGPGRARRGSGSPPGGRRGPRGGDPPPALEARRAVIPAGPVAQECVEGYLFVPDPLRLLVLRRPPARGSIWVPVSGKIDARDASPSRALVREIREETGFADLPEPIDLDWQVPFEGPDGRRWRLRAYAVRLGDPMEPVLSAEHVEAHWWPAEVARARLHYKDNRAAGDPLVAAQPGRPR